jgi:hypothetical protein
MDKIKNKAELDRELNEYTRQLAYPEIQTNKYPNITNLVNPYIGRISEESAYNALGEKSGDAYTDPYTDAQKKAGKAIAEDMYKTTDPLELGEKIKQEKNLTADIKYKVPENPKDFGAYNTATNSIELNPRITKDNLLDTVIHELGHAAAPRDREYTPREYPLSKEKDADRLRALKNKDIYKAADIVSTGHFAKPRSHTINELIGKTKEGMSVEGMEDESFEKDPKYNELDYIKSQLKDMYKYNPPEEKVPVKQEEQSLWAKVKKLLK